MLSVRGIKQAVIHMGLPPIVAVVLALAVSGAHAQDTSESGTLGSDGGAITLSALPKVVVETIAQKRPSAQIRGARVSWERDDGRYIVYASEQGREVRFVISGSGNVLNIIDVDL